MNVVSPEKDTKGLISQLNFISYFIFCQGHIEEIDLMLELTLIFGGVRFAFLKYLIYVTKTNPAFIFYSSLQRHSSNRVSFPN